MQNSPILSTEAFLMLLSEVKKHNDSKTRKTFETSLFELYNKKMLAYACSFFPVSKGVDVIQDFYLKKIFDKNLSNYPSHSITAFEKYLFTAIKNFCLTVLNQQSRQATNIDLYTQSSINQENLVAANASDLSNDYRLRQFLPLLKTRQMLAILLRLENLSCNQIAKIINTTEHNVTNLISRGRDKILKHLQKNESKEVAIKNRKDWSKLAKTIPDEQIRTFLYMVLFTDTSYKEIVQQIGLEARPLKKVMSVTLVYIRQYYQIAA